MATKHTANYQLNLWEPNDSFLRTEFNENSSKIDAALAAHDTTLAQLPEISSTLSSHTASINTLNSSELKFASGSYYGTGSSTRTLTFPFPPKLILLVHCYTGGYPCLMVQGQPTGGIRSNGYTITWSGNSVTLTASGEHAANASGATYYYCAIG